MSGKRQKRMLYRMAMLELPLQGVLAGEPIRTPADAVRVCADMGDMAQESIHVLCLSAKNTLINRIMVTLGVADSVLLHPREVFRPAIELNACGIVIVHNHPSGDPTPSAEDIRITRQMIEAGKVVDIKVVDHVIIGRLSNKEGGRDFTSLRESGCCPFE